MTRRTAAAGLVLVGTLSLKVAFAEDQCLEGVYLWDRARTAAALEDQGTLRRYSMVAKLADEQGDMVHWWRCTELGIGWTRQPPPPGAKVSELHFDSVVTVQSDALVYRYRANGLDRVDSLHWEGDCYYVTGSAKLHEYFCPAPALPASWQENLVLEDR